MKTKITKTITRSIFVFLIAISMSSCGELGHFEWPMNLPGLQVDQNKAKIENGQNQPQGLGIGFQQKGRSVTLSVGPIK